MDGTSRTQLPSDPDQWWQPGPLEGEISIWEDITDAFENVIDVIGLAWAPVQDMFLQINRSFGKVVIGEALHEALIEAGMTAKELDGMVTVYNSEIKDEWTRFTEAVAPALEATDRHWIACKHKPRCAKPPAHAKFNLPAGQRKRSKQYTR